MIRGSGGRCGGNLSLLHRDWHWGISLRPLLLFYYLFSGRLLLGLLLLLLGGLLLEFGGGGAIDEEAVLVPLLALPLGGAPLQLLHLEVLEAVVVAVVPLKHVLYTGRFFFELIPLPSEVGLELRH